MANEWIDGMMVDKRTVEERMAWMKTQGGTPIGPTSFMFRREAKPLEVEPVPDQNKTSEQAKVE